MEGDKEKPGSSSIYSNTNTGGEAEGREGNEKSWLEARVVVYIQTSARAGRRSGEGERGGRGREGQGRGTGRGVTAAASTTSAREQLACLRGR